jgi:hypothetical protein
MIDDAPDLLMQVRVSMTINFSSIDLFLAADFIIKYSPLT